MKEQQTKSKKRIVYYFLLAACVLILAAATVLTVYFVTNGDNVVKNPDDQNTPVTPPDDKDPDGDKDPDKPTGGEATKYVTPVNAAYTLGYNEIYSNGTLEHAEGLTSCYRFVEPAEGLKEGAKVEAGDKIGTVAESYGSEAKDGAHLHFEVAKNGKLVDPTTYIEAVLEEK